jgi:hypothetical protein
MKCKHGIYNPLCCVYCNPHEGDTHKFWAERHRKHTMETTDLSILVKDPQWSGIHKSQLDSTSEFNQPPVLKTAEEIWNEFSSVPEALRLAENLYYTYVEENLNLIVEEELEALNA